MLSWILLSRSIHFTGNANWLLYWITLRTVREAISAWKRRWLEIQHGKPTRVRDFWKEGYSVFPLQWHSTKRHCQMILG
jgi:hypothetical protein